MQMKKNLSIALALCLSAGASTAQVIRQDSVQRTADSLARAEFVKDSLLKDSLEAAVVYTLSTAEIPARAYYGNDWNTVNTRSTYCFDPTRTYVLPLDSAHFFFPAKGGAVISPYGPRGGRMHTGTDYKQNSGDPIYAVWDGVVRMAKTGYYGYGGIVVIRHANGLETFYAHLSKIMVKVNQPVKAGEQIGKAGRTGRATTDHLHFETRFLYQSFNSATIVDYASKRLCTDTLMVVKGKFYTAEAYRQRTAESLNIPITEDLGADSSLSPTDSLPPVQPKPKVKPNPPKKPAVHVVKSGDTLYAIARRYHTTVAKICQLNHIDENGILSLGQKIKIP